MIRAISLVLLCISGSFVLANPASDSCIEPNPPQRRFRFYIHESEPCSGRGTCVNGQCTSCESWQGTRHGKPVFIQTSGKYCECDNISCPAFNGDVCAGHGRCDCGRCVCESGYTFSDCSQKKAVVDDLIRLLQDNGNKTSV